MRKWLVLFLILAAATAYPAYSDVLDNSVGYAPGQTYTRMLTLRDATGTVTLGDSTPEIFMWISVDGVAAATLTCDVSPQLSGFFRITRAIPRRGGVEGFPEYGIGSLIEVGGWAIVDGVRGPAILYRRPLVHPDQTRQ